MGRQDTVLLPYVISSSVLQLGQLLCNPLVPEWNSFIPSENVTKTIELADPSPTAPFHAKVSLDSRGWLRAMLADAFGIGFFSGSTTNLNVVAEEMTFTGLKNADAALQIICSEENARNWIRNKKDKPIYFVTGLGILTNAKFEYTVGDVAGGHVTATVPFDATGSVPVSGTAGHLIGNFASSEGSVNGIYSCRLLKAKWKWLRKEEMPEWENKVHWKFVYEQIKGSVRDDKEFGLELEHVTDIEELIEVRDKFMKEEAEARDQRAAALIDPDNE
jgi:hypothetical protein